MIDLGPHAVFILWSYAIAAVIIIALILWVTFDERQQRRLLEKLEAQGVKRRSSRAKTDTTSV